MQSWIDIINLFYQSYPKNNNSLARLLCRKTINMILVKPIIIKNSTLMINPSSNFWLAFRHTQRLFFSHWTCFISISSHEFNTRDVYHIRHNS